MRISIGNPCLRSLLGTSPVPSHAHNTHKMYKTHDDSTCRFGPSNRIYLQHLRSQCLSAVVEVGKLQYGEKRTAGFQSERPLLLALLT